METMKYLSAQEIADSWGISKRRVQNLCVNNRIPGAVRIGNIWAIPFDAIKPKDARIREHKEKRIPEGARTRKARRELKSIVEISMKLLQDAGLSSVNALQAFIIFFAAKLLNEYIDDLDECVVACKKLFGNESSVDIPNRIAQDVDAYISNNAACLDDSLSWVYQFGSKKSESFRYRDTQFFTEKYMISTLVDSLELDLNSKVIDPACGGANFLLYSFDTLIEIVEKTIPSIESVHYVLNNLYGYEIDCFLAHVATFNLKLKAIAYLSNALEIDIAVFDSIQPKVYFPQNDSISGFLDLEWTKQLVVNCASKQIVELIDAFDGANVVVTNPPFRTIKGMPAEQKNYLQKNYPMAKCDMCNAFIQRIMEVLPSDGKAAMVTQNSWMYLDSFTPLRITLLERYAVNDIWELGSNAFYDLSGEKANVALVTFKKVLPKTEHCIGLRNLRGMSIEQIEELLVCRSEKTTSIKQIDVLNNPESRFDMFSTEHLKDLQMYCKQYKDFAVPMQGTSTGDAKNLIDYYWHHIGDSNWVLVSKGGGYSRYEGLNSYCVKWGKDGEYIKNTRGSAIRNANYFDQTQLVFSDTGTAGLNVRVLMPNQIFVASGPGIRIKSGNPLSHLAFLNSRFSAFYVRLISPKLTIAAGYIGQIPVTDNLLHSVVLAQCAERCLVAKKRRLEKRAANTEFSYVFHNSNMSIHEAARIWFQEDMHDEWTQLVNEQTIENEIAQELGLTADDLLAMDNYIGKRDIMSYEGEQDISLEQSDVISIMGYDCLPKRTKASKKSLGADGLIEYLSYIKGISCEQIYSNLILHYEWVAEYYVDLYLHSLILSAVEYHEPIRKPYTLINMITKAGITAATDKKFVAEWIETRFNKIHNESFMGSPLLTYSSSTESFDSIKE